MSYLPDRCLSREACVLLTQAHAGYDRLFNLSLDLLCIAGLDGFFKRVNPSWTRVLGWSEAEFLARPVVEFIHPDDRERTLLARADLARGIPVLGLENRYLCKDGTFRWLSWQSSAELSQSTVFGIARDITDQRQREQEQLVLSKLESTRLLAGGIAHDFNNLLAGILLNVEMVGLSDLLRSEEQEYLQQARNAIRTAGTLTQQLITFADGAAPVRRVTSVTKLLRDAVATALSGGTVREVCEIVPDLWATEIDEMQIRQVIRSLVLNAREATKSGGTVRVHADNFTLAAGANDQGAAGDYVRVVIQDSGAGIPAELLPKIFDPYFSTKRRGDQKGMGLGLTICRTVIREHGGILTINSTEGTGTTVTVLLPAHRSVSLPSEETVPAPAPPIPPSSRRILVMEDEELLRETLAIMLRRFGYEVELTSHGEEAIARYTEATKAGRPISVVLLDLTVRGGMGGDETITALRAINGNIRAVLMTGYSNQDVFRFPERLGFRCTLAKPFSAAGLKDALDRALAPAPV